MTILSRKILVHFLLKSPLLDELPKDPSFLARCWKILKVVLLQSPHGQFKQRLQARLLDSLPAWREAIEPDLSEAFRLLALPQYGESRRRSRCLDFNTDWDLCVNPQLRALLAVSTLLPAQSWSPSFRAFFQWIAAQWMALLPSGAFIVNEAAYQALLHCVRVVQQAREPFLQKWLHRALRRVTADGVVAAEIQKEIEQWPLFSSQLQKLVELALLNDSLQPGDETPEPATWHCYRFAPGGTVAVKSRALFPSWTLEFSLRLDAPLGETPLLLCSESESVLQFAPTASRGTVFQFVGENESVSFPCELPAGSWTHFALVVDAVTTVGSLIFSIIRRAAFSTRTASRSRRRFSRRRCVCRRWAPRATRSPSSSASCGSGPARGPPRCCSPSRKPRSRCRWSAASWRSISPRSRAPTRPSSPPTRRTAGDASPRGEWSSAGATPRSSPRQPRGSGCASTGAACGGSTRRAGCAEGGVGRGASSAAFGSSGAPRATARRCCCPTS